MIPLQDKPFTDAPDSDYPFGKMRDDDGSGTYGTDADTLFMGDYVQFFEKMMFESGITPNGIPDNEYSGFQLFEALRKVTKTTHKLYAISLSQTGGSAPDVNVCNDDFGGVTWTRQGAGVYRGTANTPGAFAGVKRGVLISPPTNATTQFGASVTDDYITVTTFDLDLGAGSSTLADDLLIQGYLEFKVWE